MKSASMAAHRLPQSRHRSFWLRASPGPLVGPAREPAGALPKLSCDGADRAADLLRCYSMCGLGRYCSSKRSSVFAAGSWMYLSNLLRMISKDLTQPCDRIPSDFLTAEGWGGRGKRIS